MNDKKCPVCGLEVDETAEVCPECGAKIESAADIQEIPADDAVQETVTSEGAETVSEESASEEIADAPKAKKGIKILCAVMALVLVIAAGGYWWYNNNKDAVIDVSSFGMDDINGTFTSDVIGMYMNFDATEVTADVVVQVPADEALSSAASFDGTATSSAEPQFVSEKRTFDGSFENGYSEEYINKVLLTEYIQANDLNEEYESFVEENEAAGVGLDEYAEYKGIKQEDIDSMENAQQIRDEGASYTQNGYWDYDADNKVITLYTKDGAEFNKLSVNKEGLVSLNSFLKGETNKNSTFNSTLVMRLDEYGITQTITTYKDGNYIIKQAYDDGESGVTNGGEYEVKDGLCIMDVNGNSVTYNILDDGIAGEVYIK